MAAADKIDAKQILTFTVSSQVGFGILTLSGVLAKDVGHDGWIPILIGGLAMIVFSVLMMLLLQRYGDQSILEINRHLFGKICGTALNLVLVLYLISFAAFEARAFTELTRLMLMPLTPPLLLTGALLLPTIYLTWNGLNAVCKFSQVIFVFLAFILFIGILLFNQLHFSFLQPVGAAGLSKIVKTIPAMTFVFLGPELVAFIYPAIVERDRSLKWVVQGNLITIFFYTLVFMLSITFFGEKLLQNLKLSLFDIPRFHRIGFTERIDYVFLILWFPLLESALRIYFFSAYHATRKLFHFKRNRWIYLAFILLIILLDRIPANFNQLFGYSKIISYWGFGVILFFILCYLLSFIKRNGLRPQ